MSDNSTPNAFFRCTFTTVFATAGFANRSNREVQIPIFCFHFILIGRRHESNKMQNISLLVRTPKTREHAKASKALQLAFHRHCDPINITGKRTHFIVLNQKLNRLNGRIGFITAILLVSIIIHLSLPRIN